VVGGQGSGVRRGGSWVGGRGSGARDRRSVVESQGSGVGGRRLGFEQVDGLGERVEEKCSTQYQVVIYMYARSVLEARTCDSRFARFATPSHLVGVLDY
jgi:hypothetical protein